MALGGSGLKSEHPSEQGGHLGSHAVTSVCSISYVTKASLDTKEGMEILPLNGKGVREFTDTS